MENTILVTLSRQITLQRKMDVIANNMANMNTAGFKSDELKFEEYLMPVAKVDGFQNGDKRVKFVVDPHMVRNLSAGAERQTGRDLDVALSGDGWMVVKAPQGERFTRNGQLKLSGEGTLVTSEGYPVLGEGGEITFEPGETGIVIGKDGTISSNQGTKDKLRIVEFETPQAMKKQGNSLYNSDETPRTSENTTVIQGAYETSNVQSMKEMTKMIETVRAYTSVSRMLEVADQTRGKAIQQLGRMEN
jgi:flagellar basal-body rod protein FlgF